MLNNEELTTPDQQDAGPQQINQPPYPGTSRIENGQAFDISGKPLGGVDDNGKPMAAPAVKPKFDPNSGYESVTRGGQPVAAAPKPKFDPNMGYESVTRGGQPVAAPKSWETEKETLQKTGQWVGGKAAGEEGPSAWQKFKTWVNEGVISPERITTLMTGYTPEEIQKGLVESREGKHIVHVPNIGMVGATPTILPGPGTDLDLDTFFGGMMGTSGGGNIAHVASGQTSPLMVATMVGGPVVRALGAARNYATAAQVVKAADADVEAMTAMQVARLEEFQNATKQLTQAQDSLKAAETARTAGTVGEDAVIQARNVASEAAANLSRARQASQVATEARSLAAVKHAGAVKNLSEADVNAQSLLGRTVGRLPVPQGAITAANIGQKAVGTVFTGQAGYQALKPREKDETLPDYIGRVAESGAYFMMGAHELGTDIKGTYRAAENGVQAVGDYIKTKRAAAERTANDEAQIQAKKDFSKAIPSGPGKSNYTDDDYSVARPFLEDEHKNVDEIETPQHVYDALEHSRQGIENIVKPQVEKYKNNSLELGKNHDGTPVNVMQKLVAALLPSDAVNAGFLNKGLKAVEGYNLTNPTVGEADAIRAKLNSAMRNKLNTNHWSVVDAINNDPEFAAQYELDAIMRDGVYGTLRSVGVDGAQELRQAEASIIRVRNAADRQAKNEEVVKRGTGETGGVRGLAAKGAKYAGAAAGVAIGAPAGVLGSEVGGALGAAAGAKVGEAIAKPDLKVKELIQRSMKVSGAPDTRPALTTEGAAEPAEKPAPHPRENTPLHADLATHYGEEVGDSSYADLEKRFLSDVRIKKDHHVPLESDEKNLMVKINQAKIVEIKDAQKKAEDQAEAEKKVVEQQAKEQAKAAKEAEKAAEPAEKKPAGEVTPKEGVPGLLEIARGAKTDEGKTPEEIATEKKEAAKRSNLENEEENIHGNGWLDEDGNFHPLLAGETHPEGRRRLELGGTKAIRVAAGADFVIFNPPKNTPEVRRNLISAIKNHPQLKNVEIDFEGSQNYQNLPAEQAVEWLENGAVPSARVRSNLEGIAAVGSHVAKATEPLMDVEEKRLPVGHTNESFQHHEHGHNYVAARLGIESSDIASHEHEDIAGNLSAAGGIGWKETPYVLDSKVAATKTPEELWQNTKNWLTIYMGGAAANEVLDGMSLEDNSGLKGDVRQARKVLAAHGIEGKDANILITDAHERAKKLLTEPGALDIIRENAKVREENLPTTLHASAGRMENIREQIRRNNEQNQNPTPNGGAREGGGTTPEGQPRVAREGAAVGTEGRTEARPEVRVPPERTTGAPERDQAIKDGGGVPGGIQPGFSYSDKTTGEAKRFPDLALFHDPTSGSTLALPSDQVTPELVKQHLTDSRAKYAEAETRTNANKLAESIGAKVVGSAAEPGATPRDIDLRIEGKYDDAAVEDRMKKAGFEYRGSSVVSPKEAKTSGKVYAEGWNRAEHFENAEGKKVDIWHSEPEVENAQLAVHEANGGSTFTPEGENLAGKDLHAVGAYPNRTVQVDKLTPEVLNKFKADNADVLSQGDHSVGTWKDPDTGKTVLDVSKLIKDRDEAIAVGKAANQKAIYHLGGDGEIPTGGTGEGPTSERSMLLGPDVFRDKLKAITSGDFDQDEMRNELALLKHEANQGMHQANMDKSNWHRDYWRGNLNLIKKAEAKLGRIPAAPTAEEQLQERIAKGTATPEEYAANQRAEGARMATAPERSMLEANYHPALQSMADKVGLSDDASKVRDGASFITPDGKFLHLSAQHPDAIEWYSPGYRQGASKAEGGDIRIPFINDTNAIRTRFTTGKAGNELAVSVPKAGVSPEQVVALKQAVAQGLGRNGNLIIEQAAREGKASKIYEFAKPSDVDAALREIGAHPAPKRSMLEGGEEGFAFGKNTEGTEDQQKGLISTRVPSGTKAEANPLEQDLKVGREAIASVPGMADKMANLVREYPGVRIPENIKDPNKVLDRFVDHVSNNLVKLYDGVPDEVKNANMKWYDSANQMAGRIAEKYGKTTKQLAGVIAAMSPQKDWDQNVSLAERVSDIYHTKQDEVATPEMMSKAAEIGSRPTGKIFAEIGPKLKGKRLSELTDPAEKAAWVRLWDEAHNPREFQSIDPATGMGRGIVKTTAGEPKRVSWGGLNEIGKAINILENGSRENISDNLGDAHKVRNFYNNIVDPNNPAGHVTIDTHAVAAGLMRMLSGKSTEVLHNFGAGGAPGSTKNGINGTYPLFADAYRQAAAEVGVQPRQLQSVTWEEIRKMFPAEMKRITERGSDVPKHVAAVDDLWNQYAKDRKISLDKTHEDVRQYAQKAANEMAAAKKASGPGKISALDFLGAMGQGGLFALKGGEK